MCTALLGLSETSLIVTLLAAGIVGGLFYRILRRNAGG